MSKELGQEVSLNEVREKLVKEIIKRIENFRRV